MFEEEINEYDALFAEYKRKVMGPMGAGYEQYCEILFAAHSCAIEGNSFSVDDTRELKEKGLGMIPKDKTLLEAFEILDHFDAYEYVHTHLDRPLDESFVKEINRRVMHHTLSYKYPEAVPGEYTTFDMAAGDTVFGDHRELTARLPKLLEATNKAIADNVHPMIVAARFHGFFEYLHPFPDGNGRTGRLLSNFILMQQGHPIVPIRKDDREEYILALKNIRKEHTDEYLISFFFRMAITRMRDEMKQRDNNTRRLSTFIF